MNLREIDKLVAEKALKQETRIRWVVTKKKYEYKFYNVNGDETWLPLPEFSSDIKDAWYVVEKLRDRYVYMNLTNNDDSYCCELMEQDLENSSRYFTYYADAETAPLAICLATLKLYGIDVEV